MCWKEKKSRILSRQNNYDDWLQNNNNKKQRKWEKNIKKYAVVSPTKSTHSSKVCTMIERLEESKLKIQTFKKIDRKKKKNWTWIMRKRAKNPLGKWAKKKSKFKWTYRIDIVFICKQSRSVKVNRAFFFLGISVVVVVFFLLHSHAQVSPCV